MHRKMVKSNLISGGHIPPGTDMTGYENLAGFRPGLDMISGATLTVIHNSTTFHKNHVKTFCVILLTDKRMDKER